MTTPTTIWVRAETKVGERRTPVTPRAAEALLSQGYVIVIERSEQRIFHDEEYQTAGCKLAEPGSWISAPASAYILGVKELPESVNKLDHKHIYFAHCFKYQSNWRKTLSLFTNPNASLLDLEFLTDSRTGRRLAAFGYYAGFAGAALGIRVWLDRQAGIAPGEAPPASPWPSAADATRELAQRAKEVTGRLPRVIVFGALGRCGKGALDCLKDCGISPENISAWDIEQTKAGGPFEEILEHDIMVNCVYLGKTVVPPFITNDQLARLDKKLGVVVDVSADSASPHNPIPIYKRDTTLQSPSVVAKGDVDVIAIDHLPTLLPRDASEDFSSQLLPALNVLQDHASGNREAAKIWFDAEAIFKEKMAEAGYS